MKYLVASLILFMCTLQTFCQQEYFVYLQTDNNQAFYVRLNNKVYSSTSSGYLILPKMADSAVSVTIGFAKSVSPEQQFNIPVSNKDAGYIVKNFEEKGWGLFNLQTQAVVMNSNPLLEKKNLEITGIKKTDEFSVLLANAVNDTAVLYTVSKPKKIIPAPEIVAVAEKKKDSIITATKETPPAKDSVAFVKTEPEKTDSIVTAKVTPKPDTIDTVSITKTVPPVVKEPAPEKMEEKHDTVVVAKNTTSPTTSPATTAKNTNPLKNLFGFGKTEPKPRKDTIIMIDSNAAAKNKERKDTIIIMQHTAPEKAITKNTAPPSENKPSVVPSPTKDAAINETATKRPAVGKVAELLTDTSYVAIFVEQSKGKFDTIRISIPFNEAASTTAKNKPVVKEVKPDSITGDKDKKDSPVVIKEQAAPAKDIPAVTTADTNKAVKAPSLSVNSDCKEAALDADIDKVRIKMMQAVSDEDKIALAKKVYRLKCFSVKQVRALSELYKTDEGKYKWFDAVYPFVSDNNNFASLSELIKNEYYLNRFKAMLRN